MNAELLRRWTDETVPALCELCEDMKPYYDGQIWYRPHDFLDTPYEKRERFFMHDSLDSLHRISELIGAITCAFGFIMEDGAGNLVEYWSYAWVLRDGSDAYESEPEYSTEIEARLTAVCDVVAALVREKEAGNERN